MQATTERVHYDLTRLINNWEPPARAHCSNCSNCRVYGNADSPLVYCKAGFDADKRVEMGRLIRSVRPVGFRSAEKCLAFESMGSV